MKNAIIYVSNHHENTKKLVLAISKTNEVELIDGTKEIKVDLESFDSIGFASGIAYSKLYPEIIEIMNKYLPNNKKVFFIYTCGSMQPGYTNAVKKIAKAKNCEILGEYGCLGFDTNGPFKLVGGIAKGHPNDDEINNAVKFYEEKVINN